MLANHLRIANHNMMMMHGPWFVPKLVNASRRTSARVAHKSYKSLRNGCRFGRSRFIRRRYKRRRVSFANELVTQVWEQPPIEKDDLHDEKQNGVFLENAVIQIMARWLDFVFGLWTSNRHQVHLGIMLNPFEMIMLLFLYMTTIMTGFVH